MSRILVVDDEASILSVLHQHLELEGFDVVQAIGGERAQEILQTEVFDLMISDIRMEPVNGLELLRMAKTIHPNMATIMMTAHGSVETSVEAMKEGAFDYVLKPFKLDEIKITVQRALEYQHLRSENDQLRSQLQARHGFAGMIAGSDAMRKICDMITMVAPTDNTVLISGESGTGKEVVAKTIHANSVRRKKPFVAVNCSGIPETLLESELFGHVRGAFSDAKSDRDGLFKAAEGGTLFLDEIGTMPINLQAKLLRALQEREIRPVGSDKDMKVNVRVIAATNEDMQSCIANKTFREDPFSAA